MKGPSGPIGVVKKSRGFSAAQERHDDRIAKQDREEDSEKIPSPPTIDKLSMLVNDPVFCTDYTWPFLYVPDGLQRMRQLFVSRFYIHSQFALDTFPAMIPDMADIELKKKLLGEHGIKYFCLHPGNSQADLVAYLGE
jgi:hypothetical protein